LELESNLQRRNNSSITKIKNLPHWIVIYQQTNCSLANTNFLPTCQETTCNTIPGVIAHASVMSEVCCWFLKLLNGLKYKWPKKAVFSKTLLNFKSLTIVPTPYCLTTTGHGSGGHGSWACFGLAATCTGYGRCTSWLGLWSGARVFRTGAWTSSPSCRNKDHNTRKYAPNVLLFLISPFSILASAFPHMVKLHPFLGFPNTSLPLSKFTSLKKFYDIIGLEKCSYKLRQSLPI
jgi:hypothetical protein